MASNDTRGWILASVSGVACVFGACVICVDFLVRLFPGQKDFEIRRSNAFLSNSLSLSFGVMLFSALYHMLPEAKNSLMDGGFSKSSASWTLIGCFLGGVIGIQILSRAFHSLIPSHVVDCEHTHDDQEQAGNGHHGHEQSMHRQSRCHDHHEPSSDGQARDSSRQPADRPNKGLAKMASETDALLGKRQRPSPLRTRVSSVFPGSQDNCDEQGFCHGFTDPCVKECFVPRMQSPTNAASPSLPGSKATRRASVSAGTRQGPNRDGLTADESRVSVDGGADTGDDDSASGSTAAPAPPDSPDLEQGMAESHHHHVPDNAFLAIGVQTSIAIALHKLPEGFITYATNHANPQLGFSIFVALFIHNITEGFALALPLFLAMNSRWKAILASTFLGGASQPIGALIAMLWFLAAKQRGVKPDETVYGCMFAVTSGIMTSVALQIFSESLARTHNRTLCIVWAFVGMGILGFSSALTAEG